MNEYIAEDGICIEIIPARESTDNVSPNNIRLKIFESEEVFVEMGKPWKDLEERSGATFFNTLEWASSWWKHFGAHPRRSLFVVTLWDQEKIIGLLPLYKARSSFGTAFSQTRLHLIGFGGAKNEQAGFTDNYGISDFLDFLVDDQYRGEVAAIASRMIAEGFMDADILEFYPVREDSFIFTYLLPVLEGEDLEIQKEKKDICPVIDLKGISSLKQYIREAKSNARRRFRQTLRALNDEQPYFTEHPVTSSGELDAAIGHLVRLHQSRWNRIGFPGIFYDRRFYFFFKEIINKAFRQNKLWFCELRDEQGVCASRMLFRHKGRYYDYISGFDDTRKSAKYRPGIGLLLRLVEKAVGENAEGVELLRGDESYKEDFSSSHISVFRLTLIPKNEEGKLGKIPGKTFYLLSSAYTALSREWQLMKIQKKEKGMAKMLPGYLSFRWQTLKMKIDS